MRSVEARANLVLVIALIVLPVTFALVFTVISGDVLTGTSRVIAGAVVLVVVGALTGLGTLQQARRFGGLSQLRAFRRAIRRSGQLPSQADIGVWRSQLEVLREVQRPVRQRLLWAWFGLTMSTTQSIVEGADEPISIAILAALGAVIGVGVGQVVLVTSARLRRNIQSLLDQIDERSTRTPA